MTTVLPNSVSKLDQQVVVRWTGCEMAMAEGGSWEMDASGMESFAPGEIVWSHPNVPYLQFVDVCVTLADGQTLSLQSQCEDGTGVHGLYVGSAMDKGLMRIDSSSGIFRHRELSELPTGLMTILKLRRDGTTSNVIEIHVLIGSTVVQFLSGEVYEREGGRFEVVELDESILIQVDGKIPGASATK